MQINYPTCKELMVQHCNDFKYTLGLKVIKLFRCSTQLSMKSILLTIIGILTFISMINAASESFQARKGFIFHHFTFYEPLKFHAHLS